MLRELKKIFEEIKVPPFADFQRYLNKTMFKNEQHKFEKHLIDNPLSSDALDGFATENDKYGLQEEINSINDLIDKKVNKSRPGLSSNSIMYAAASIVLLLLVGTVVFFSTNSSQEAEAIAVNYEQEKIEKESEINPAPIISQNKDTSLNSELLQDTMIAESEEEIVLPGEVNPNAPLIASNEYKANGSAVTQLNQNQLNNLEQEDVVAEEDVSLNEPALNAEVQQDKLMAVQDENKLVKAKKTEASRSSNTSLSLRVFTSKINSKEIGKLSATANSNVKAALEKFNNGDISGAEEIIKIAKQGDPSNEDLQMLNIIIKSNKGKVFAASGDINALLKSGKYGESAKWLKSGLEIQNGNNDKAKKLLKSLSKKKSIYKEEAKSILDQL